MNLQFREQKLMSDRSEADVIQSNLAAGEQPEQIGVVFNNPEKVVILEQTFKAIDYCFGTILDQVEHNWKKIGGRKWLKEKQKKFERDLEIQTVTMKKVIYNIVADWEQKLMFQKNSNWYANPNNLNDQQATNCHTCGQNHFQHFDHLANLIYEERKIEELKRLQESRFEEAKKGLDADHNPFTRETFLFFNAIQNGIAQDLQNLFGYLERDRLDAMLQIAYKQTQDLPTEQDDLRILKILNHQALVLRYIYHLIESLNKVNEVVLLKNPEFNDLFQRDDFLFSKKQALWAQIQEHLQKQPDDEKLQCLFHYLQTEFTEVAPNLESQPPVQNEHNQVAEVIVPKVEEQAVAKTEPDNVEAEQVLDNNYWQNHLPEEVVQITEFLYQEADQEPQVIANNKQPAEETEPTVRFVQLKPQTRKSVPEIAPFRFQKLPDSQFNTNWNFNTTNFEKQTVEAPAEPFKPTKAKVVTILEAVQPFSAEQPKILSGQTKKPLASGSDSNDTTNNQKVKEFSFGKIDPANFNIRWGKFYQHEFVIKPEPVQELNQPVVETIVEEKLNFSSNPIDLIEEIIEEFADPIPEAEPEVVEPDLKLAEIYEDEPEEVRLKRLKLKKMSKSGQRLLMMIEENSKK